MTIDGPRACTKAELPEVIALVDAELGRKGTGQTLLTDYPLVYEDRNLENIRILRVDGELASVVPFIVWPVEHEGCRFSFANISPTATAPAHRRKGYGRRCLQDCVRKMTALGCELSILRTQVATFPFYETEEFQAVEHQAWVYRCTREDAGRFADQGESVLVPNRLAPEQLAGIRAMHDDGGGSVRTAERSAALFSLPKMRTLLAYRGARLAGYLLVSGAVNMPGLVEAGGDESAIETLVHRALSELAGDAACLAHVNLNPSRFAQVLEPRLPGRRQPAPENRMIRINRPDLFFAGIAPWLERANRGIRRHFSIRVAGATVGFRFTADGLSLGADRLEPNLEMTRRQLVSAVFGPHPACAEAPRDLAGLPRYSFPVWLLDRT